ncbi:TPA: hypothetical protein LA460_000283 [Clostridium botulinum]|nr:hypothetical protein [Clostridium botulinum]HBJ1652887.1 hypothetical protein [Clostridium botulinum]
MKRKFDIFYNDGAYYGTFTFTDKSQEEIEELIQEEIDDNNITSNTLYHITRDNFKEV